MVSIPEKQIDAIIERHAALQARMATGDMAPADFVAASKEFAELEPVARAASEVTRLRAELVSLNEMLADPEMKAMAAEEIAAVEEALPAAEHDLAIKLLPKDVADERAAMLEIRAGTGGDEAALFAGDLLRMYSRYADGQGWKVEIISANEAEVGGYKEVVASVTGQGVFAKLKFESGVHRVQRVPATESQGRIHTSAATVAVLPEAEEVDVAINDSDLKIDIYRASGAGGQHVNTTDSAIRITHIPSGLVVIQQDQRSQHKNRAKAMQVLRARLYEIAERERDAEQSAERRSQVGGGGRSEKIRTYNFKENRVTDHRIGFTIYRLSDVLAGDLDLVVEPLLLDERTRQLAAFDG